MDAVPSGSNSGLMSRVAYTTNGNEVTLEGPIHTDMFQQDRFILNGVKIVIKCHPSNRKFTLMTDDTEEYKVQITSTILRVCHIKVSNAVILAQMEVKWKSNFKTISIPPGVSTLTSDDIFHGSVPSKLILGMVLTKASPGITH